VYSSVLDGGDGVGDGGGGGWIYGVADKNRP